MGPSRPPSPSRPAAPDDLALRSSCRRAGSHRATTRCQHSGRGSRPPNRLRRHGPGGGGRTHPRSRGTTPVALYHTGPSSALWLAMYDASTYEIARCAPSGDQSMSLISPVPAGWRTSKVCSPLVHVDRVDRAPSRPPVVRDPGPVRRPHQVVRRVAFAVLGTDHGPEIGLTTGRGVDEGHIAAVHDGELVLGGRPGPGEPALVRGELSRSAADGVGDPEALRHGTRPTCGRGTMRRR